MNASSPTRRLLDSLTLLHTSEHLGVLTATMARITDGNDNIPPREPSDLAHRLGGDHGRRDPLLTRLEHDPRLTPFLKKMRLPLN